MKNIFKTFILLTLLCSTWACTSPNMFEEESILVDNEITKIEAVIEPFEIGEGTNARTTITLGEFGKIGTLVWAEGDTIGIYPSQGDQLSFPIVDGVGKTRCEFSGGGWALKGSTETTTYTYSAYSPFNRNYYFQKDNKALPVSMLGQKQIGNNNSSHLGAYDIQLAKGETPTSGTLVFEFKHQASYVRMDITAPCKANWKNITLESNATFTTKAAINLSESIPTISPTLQSNSISLELENVNTNDSLHIVAYMMMLPVDFTGKTLTMKLTDTDDNVYSAPVTFVNPINAANYLNFAANKARWISAEFEEGATPTIATIPYVTFTAEDLQSFTLSKPINTLEYSLNGSDWTVLDNETIIFGGNEGKLQLRGKSPYGTAKHYELYYSNVIFGNEIPVYCSGDIRTLIDYEHFETCETGNAKFCSLFKNCYVLQTAPALPATTLAKDCYREMFYGCSLSEAPSLPATTLTDNCYSYMFANTGLVQAPSLPATTLTKNCYEGMFSRCSLTSAPTLPATTLAEGCYAMMFYYCTSLTEAPALPATTLAESCYSNMFYYCTSLTEAPALPATTLADYCYGGMFVGCSSLSEAPLLPATTLAEGCYIGMFNYCESLLSAPTLLPAVVLEKDCYLGMFAWCHNLKNAPILPAPILAERCYNSMFQDCNNLKEITMLATDISAYECLDYWLNVVSSTGTFIKSPEMDENSFEKGRSGIPEGWIVINYEDDANLENPKDGETIEW